MPQFRRERRSVGRRPSARFRCHQPDKGRRDCQWDGDPTPDPWLHPRKHAADFRASAAPWHGSHDVRPPPRPASRNSMVWGSPRRDWMSSPGGRMPPAPPPHPQPETLPKVTLRGPRRRQRMIAAVAATIAKAMGVCQFMGPAYSAAAPTAKPGRSPGRFGSRRELYKPSFPCETLCPGALRYWQ